MDNPEKVIFRPHQRGCISCSGRGYKGRAGLYELLVPSPEINEMVKDSKSDVDIRKMAYDQGMSSLQNEGFQCVKNGVTSIEEVKRVL